MASKDAPKPTESDTVPIIVGSVLAVNVICVLAFYIIKMVLKKPDTTTEEPPKIIAVKTLDP